jgi:outer membrane protein assembly factor BamB
MPRTGIATLALAVVLLLLAARPVSAADVFDRPSLPPADIDAQSFHEDHALWQMPLAGALVEDMKLLTPGRLLVALRADALEIPNLPILLVDTRTGFELWRHEREQKAARWEPVLTDSVGLLYRVDDGRKPKLVCLDARSGAVAWTSPLAPGAIPLADRTRGTLLVVEAERGRVTLRSLAFADGSERWRRAVTAAGKDASPPHPLLAGADIIHFTNGIERLAGGDGHPLWTRADLVVSDGAPDARLDGDALFAIGTGGTLVELDAGSGVTRRTVALPPGVDWDALEVSGSRVYTRGLRSEGASVLAAVDRAAGRLMWAHDCEAPPMSNVVEAGERVFVATSGSVIALDAASGKTLGVWEATNATRPYPVHLRRVGGQVVYIGELMVAAFDARTGARAWSRGWSPISNTASLVALDASLPQLRAELAGLAGRKVSGSKSGTDASFARLESARFQNMAADYHRRADVMSSDIDRRSQSMSQNERHIARMGVGIERSSSITAISGQIANAQIDAAFGRAEAMMNLQFALMDLAQSIERAKAVAATQTVLSRQVMFRRAVLSGYAGMESEDYVYRPGMEFSNGRGPFVGVTVAQLATGRTVTAMLSPLCRDYGLWNVVDFERGVVYHHGIGLETSLYNYLAPRRLGGEPTRIVGNFLIASPIRIPR